MIHKFRTAIGVHTYQLEIDENVDGLTASIYINPEGDSEDPDFDHQDYKEISLDELLAVVQMADKLRSDPIFQRLFIEAGKDASAEYDQDNDPDDAPFDEPSCCCNCDCHNNR